MNVEQLRKQAKELVRAARGGDPSALARLGDLPVRLASAQLVLAREHGYPSWPALVRVEVEQPFHDDIEYYEGRADGIATVNGVPDRRRPARPRRAARLLELGGAGTARRVARERGGAAAAVRARLPRARGR